MKALILVDLQNDFCPGGALPVPQGDAVIDLANRLEPHFPLVVATQDWHPADHSSFAANHPGKQPGDEIVLAGLPQRLWPVHCVQHTPGAEFHPRLQRAAIAAVFRKGTDPTVDSYSGFFDNGHRQATGLDAYLKEHGVDCVYVCGLATEYCVQWTALDAVALGFETYLVEDASRGVNLAPGDAARAIETLRARGVHVIQSAAVSDATSADPAEPRVLAEGRFLRLLSYRGWEWAARTNCTAAAIIVAVTEARELLLVEQYRIPLGARVIELPAGLIGDVAGSEAESLLEGARRELREETGYEAARFEYLLEGPSSAGMTNECYALVLASGARQVAPGGGDASEDIQVHVVPLAGVDDWLDAHRRAGAVIDPRIYAGLYFAKK